MDKQKKEKQHQKKEQEKFNSVTNSVKPENQNQSHNVRQEGIGKQNNKYQACRGTDEEKRDGCRMNSGIPSLKFLALTIDPPDDNMYAAQSNSLKGYRQVPAKVQGRGIGQKYEQKGGLLRIMK